MHKPDVSEANTNGVHFLSRSMGHLVGASSGDSGTRALPLPVPTRSGASEASVFSQKEEGQR